MAVHSAGTCCTTRALSNCFQGADCRLIQTRWEKSWGLAPCLLRQSQGTHRKRGAAGCCQGTACTAVQSHKIFGVDGRDSESCRCVLGSRVHLRAGEATSLQQQQDKRRESERAELTPPLRMNLTGAGGSRPRSRPAAVKKRRSAEHHPGKEGARRAPSIAASPAAAPLDGGAHPPLPPPASPQPARIPRSPVQHPGNLRKGTRRAGTAFRETPRDDLCLVPAINGRR